MNLSPVSYRPYAKSNNYLNFKARRIESGSYNSNRLKDMRKNPGGLKNYRPFSMPLLRHEIEELAAATKKLASDQNMNLYTYGMCLNSYINPSSNQGLFLYVAPDDFRKMNSISGSLARSSGSDGIYELSVLGTDKKAAIRVPANELTEDMKTIDNSIQMIHPFLIDMTLYLDRHPEIIAEIEENIGDIDLSKVSETLIKTIGVDLINK